MKKIQAGGTTQGLWCLTKYNICGFSMHIYIYIYIYVKCKLKCIY